MSFERGLVGIMACGYPSISLFMDELMCLKPDLDKTCILE